MIFVYLHSLVRESIRSPTTLLLHVVLKIPERPKLLLLARATVQNRVYYNSVPGLDAMRHDFRSHGIHDLRYRGQVQFTRVDAVTGSRSDAGL